MVYKKLYQYNTKYDLYDKLVRIHLLFKHIDIQEQNIKVLIYFVVFGVNKTAEEHLLKDGVVKHKQQIYNSKTLLKEQGLIYKKRNKQWFLIDEFKEKIDIELTIMVKCIKN